MRTHAVHNGMAWTEETAEWAALPLGTLLPALWVEGLSHTQEDAEACWHDPSTVGAARASWKWMTINQTTKPTPAGTQRGGRWKEAAWHICKSEWTVCEILGPQWKLVICWPGSVMILFLSQKMGRGMPCLWHKKLRVLLLYILAVEVIPYSQTSKSYITTLCTILKHSICFSSHTLYYQVSSHSLHHWQPHHWHSPVITQF